VEDLMTDQDLAGETDAERTHRRLIIALRSLLVVAFLTVLMVVSVLVSRHDRTGNTTDAAPSADPPPCESVLVGDDQVTPCEDYLSRGAYLTYVKPLSDYKKTAFVDAFRRSYILEIFSGDDDETLLSLGAVACQYLTSQEIDGNLTPVASLVDLWAYSEQVSRLVITLSVQIMCPQHNYSY
jgi:hypothetical protein